MSSLIFTSIASSPCERSKRRRVTDRCFRFAFPYAGYHCNTGRDSIRGKKTHNQYKIEIPRIVV